MTKSAGSWRNFYIYRRNPSWKTSFFVSCMSCKNQSTTSKVIRDGHTLKESNYTTEDKIKDFIQKGVNEKLYEVVYQFSSIFSLLPDKLIKLIDLSTANSYWEYFKKWDSWSKKFQEVSTIPVAENLIIFYLVFLFCIEL